MSDAESENGTYLNISSSDIKHVVTERDFVSMMIDLYRNKPVLWKVKHPQYCCKQTRAAAVQEIVQELQQFNPEFDEDKFKRKVNTIRTNFNKQRNKIERAKALGLIDERPALWYYNELLFILDQDNDEDNAAANHIVNEYNDSFEEREHNLEETFEEKYRPPVQKRTSSAGPLKKKRSRPGFNIVSVKRKKVPLPDPEPETEVDVEDSADVHNEDSDEKDYDETNKTEKPPDPEQYMTITTTYYKKPKSRENLLAEIWANKLKKLTPSQKLHAEKIINDVLYEGELGNLTKNGVSFIPTF